MKQFNTLVFIGRMQPLHNGHVHVIREAAERAERVLILLGSANCAISPKNPFTYEQRKGVIELCCREMVDSLGSRLLVVPVNDYTYNDTLWVTEIQRTLAKRYLGEKVGLIGYSKDSSSYYLKMFPGMPSVNITAQWGTLNATDIRENYLRKMPILPDVSFVPQAQIDFMKQFCFTEEFKWLVKEAEFYREYPKHWGEYIISCVDNVVIQSGHILLVKRKHCPGQGLWALPGGHVNIDETFQDAAIRELTEETAISDGHSKKGMPKAVLQSYIRDSMFFDDPERSLRKRVVTMAFKYELPAKKELFYVKGNDDAEYAQWVKLGDVDPRHLFEDHYFIIQTMTNRGSKISEATEVVA